MARKLFVFDMDGTLTTAQKDQILPETIAALKKAKAKGHALAIATGRPLAFIKQVAGFELFDYLICNNGAYYYEQKSGQVYFEGFLPYEVIDEMITMAKTHDLALFLSTGGDTICAIREDNDHLHAYIVSLWKRINITSFKKLLLKFDKNKITQSTLLASPLKIAALQKEFMKNKDKVEIRIADRKYLDACPKNVSKYLAIMKILPKLKVTNANTIAFGDSDNDIEMLKGAGYGIAMANATNTAKKAANEVIGNNLVPSIANKILELIKE